MYVSMYVYIYPPKDLDAGRVPSMTPDTCLGSGSGTPTNMYVCMCVWCVCMYVCMVCVHVWCVCMYVCVYGVWIRR
jgi:hypothetical protein